MTGRSLGSGAYATVFLAEDRQTNQQLIVRNLISFPLPRRRFQPRLTFSAPGLSVKFIS